MKKLIQIALYLFLFLGLGAQGETDWWYFGDQAGLHFTNDTVVPVFNSQVTSSEGYTSMSDSQGNLLYYGNGAEVYNANHEIMVGADQVGDGIATSVKMNDSIYCHIHVSWLGGGDNGYVPSYAFINMNSNGGLGELLDIYNGIDTVSNFVTCTKKSTGSDYWVVYRQPFGNTFVTYSLSEDGIDFDNPLFSNTGSDYLNPWPLPGWGSLKINPSGNILAFIHTNYVEDLQVIHQGKLELFHFNNETGLIGERITRIDETNTPYYDLVPDPTFAGYSVEFSPDGEKMYFTSAGKVYQCNINSLDSTLIVQSIYNFNLSNHLILLSGLQLAIDGRVYITTGPQSFLGAIHFPNIVGIEAGFEMEALDLSPTNTRRYLPVFNPSLFSSGFTVSNRCLFDETQFTLIYDLPYEYVFWEFGDGDTSTAWEPIHVYSETGIYTVQLTTVIEEDTTIKEMEVIIEGFPNVDLGPDSSLFCEGDTLVLDAYNYASYYTWQDSSYQSTFDVTDEGKYYVEVKNICGQDSDTVNFVLDRDNVHLGSDTLICIEEPLLLLADQPTATSWLWQDGSTLPFYEAQVTGEYYVEVTTPCLFIYDSIYVDTKLCSLLPPNIITPNADGINDYFVVENLYEFGYSWSLEVFNRWGKQVYYSAMYQNNWKGDQLNDGVYFYILRSRKSDRSYNGSVTILRK